MLNVGQLVPDATRPSPSLRALTPAEIELVAGGTTSSEDGGWDSFLDLWNDFWDWLAGSSFQSDEDWIQGSFDNSDDLLFTSSDWYDGTPGVDYAWTATMEDGRVYSDTDGNGRFDMITADNGDTSYMWNVEAEQWDQIPQQ